MIHDRQQVEEKVRQLVEADALETIEKGLTHAERHLAQREAARGNIRVFADGLRDDLDKLVSQFERRRAAYST